MKELKVHIWLVMLWEFKNNKNATESKKKVFSVYSRGVITHCQVGNWFLEFRSGDTSLSDESWPGRLSELDQDALTEFIIIMSCH